jgi:hypothetical protein
MTVVASSRSADERGLAEEQLSQSANTWPLPGSYRTPSSPVNPTCSDGPYVGAFSA